MRAIHRRGEVQRTRTIASCTDDGNDWPSDVAVNNASWPLGTEKRRNATPYAARYDRIRTSRAQRASEEREGHPFRRS